METEANGECLDLTESTTRSPPTSKATRVSRQFWQAGEFLPELEDPLLERKEKKTGLDHARLHPRFLHSNATSHKWALGALVELLDNSMDEVEAGCNYVSVDQMDHPIDGENNPMLLVEDNGGGMNPSTIRNCMSFGFSLKHGKKMIGQYGNGFKTATMRLGADALVLTKNTSSQTCSIGLLSYTFLTETNSQDVVVPIIDYDLQERSKIASGDENDWKSKSKIICDWGPFASEAEIWNHLDSMSSQGTRVYIWNLWQTSDDLLELDFESDGEDIRLRGSEEETQDTTNRKKRIDEGMRRCHAYKHSLRAYVSLLYLEWPEGFQITLRGKEIHPIPVDVGMKHLVVYDYRPRSLPKDDQKPAEVKVHIGFAKEAPETSVSGFCVYHRNRLIKPFWKVYTSASSVGRGVIGFLQVDFVEPAHDKQDFENTPPLQKLEKYLRRQVPHYWRSKASLVGYQDHPPARSDNSAAQDISNSPKSSKKPPPSSVSPSKPVTRSDNIPESTTVEDDLVMETKESSGGVKSKPGKNTGIVKSGSSELSGQKVETAPKTPSKCFQEMQHQITELQKSVQEFCNKYSIKDDAQKVLGRIFGTTMSRVLDPAKELKKMHTNQVKLFRNVLHYIAEMKTNMKLTGPIPPFILNEMQDIGIQVEALTENGDFMKIDSEPTVTPTPSSKTKEKKEESSRPSKRKVVHAETTKEEGSELKAKEKAEESAEEDATPQITPEGVVPLQRSHESTSQRRDSIETPPTRRQKTEQSNQELARLGFSVMEKYLKTKPNKMEIVQLPLPPARNSELSCVGIQRVEEVPKPSAEPMDYCPPEKPPDGEGKQKSPAKEDKPTTSIPMS